MNDRSGENNGGAWQNRRDRPDQTDSEKHNRQKPPEQFHCESKSVERLKSWSGSVVMLSKALQRNAKHEARLSNISVFAGALPEEIIRDSSLCSE
ncbi:MAG: hypothetical protein WCD54_04245 [Pseudolabrys sp.]